MACRSNVAFPWKGHNSKKNLVLSDLFICYKRYCNYTRIIIHSMNKPLHPKCKNKYFYIWQKLESSSLHIYQGNKVF